MNTSTPIRDDTIGGRDTQVGALKPLIVDAIVAHARRGGRVDLRGLSLSADFLTSFAELFFAIFADIRVANLVGPELSAVPLLTAIQTYAQLRGIVINVVVLRREPHPHGHGRLLEGAFIDAPTIAVDDIVNTAATMERLRQALAAEARPIAAIYTAFTTRTPSARKWVSHYNIPIIAAVSYEDLPEDIQPTSAPALSRAAALFRIAVIQQWAPPVPNTVLVGARGEPAMSRRRIFVGTDDGRLHAISRSTFQTEWEYQADTLGYGIWSKPLYAAGRVYFSTDAGSLHCLEADSGRQIWSTLIGDTADGMSICDYDTLITTAGHQLPSNQGSICIVDIVSGKLLHRIPTTGRIRDFAKHPTRPIVIAGSRDGEIIAVDISCGRELWKTHVSANMWAAPQFTADGALAVVPNNRSQINVIGPDDGAIVATATTDGPAIVQPLVLGNTAYIATRGGQLHAFDLPQCDNRRTYQTEGAILCAPSLIDDHIWIGTNRGTIEAIAPAGMHLAYATIVDDRIVGRIVTDPLNQAIYARTNNGRLLQLALTDPQLPRAIPIVIRRRQKDRAS